MMARHAGTGTTWRSAGRARVAVLAAALLALSLAGCSLGSGSSSGASAESLNALHWCDQPLVSFQDDSQPSQQPLTQWSEVKGQLGFTPYLPATLPKDSCLDLVGGSIHDPVFGAHLSVTWVLPKTGPLSFSEAPKRNTDSSAPQCAQSQQGTDTTTICIGTMGDASITIASHLSESELQAYFSKLQSNVDWAPTAPAPTTAATATATGN